MNAVIKICGIRDTELAKKTVNLGAQYVGIMMYPGSKRYVDLDQALKIAHAVKSVGGIPVAVFVDATADQMQAKCEAMGIDTVQLHGSSPRTEHHQLPDNYHRIYVLQVSREGIFQGDSDRGAMSLKEDRDLLLYDGIDGGSGKPFSLEHFKNPYDLPFLLAGGLRPETVENAIKQVHPFGVDVSSGVEVLAGVKDLDLIKTFIQKVHEANNE